MARTKALVLGGRLGLEQALEAARGPRPVRFAPRGMARAKASLRRVQQAVEAREWVYGVTTGFGSNSKETIDPRHEAELQRNLIVSHALGEGEPFPDEVVRLALLLRLHALAQGHSGVRPQTLQALARLYERDVLPVVPCRGSVGASGDLAPLSCLVLPLLGEGQARTGGRVLPARRALAAAGLRPHVLAAKEGLALVNGMQVTLALCLLALHEAEVALRTADVCAALTLEALAGRSDAFDARLHAVRPHPGQAASAARIRALVAGSRLVDAPIERIPGKRRAPQDAYGVRCAPQVHGACADGMAFAREVFTREIDAATDNPLVLGGDILSGGNFHGEPLALAADHLKLCTHELGSISERRLATLVDAHVNEGLPPYLAPRKGLHSGFMIPQYVAAALVSETKTLCFPASADSIPTGCNIEDHVSMGPIAARRAREVAARVHSVLALEVLAACQAIDLRPLAPGRRMRAVLDRVRQEVPFRPADAPWEDALPRVTALVASGALLEAAGL